MKIKLNIKICVHQFLGHHLMKLLGNFSFDNKFSIGDDNVMYKWNTNNSTASQLMQLDAFSVDHDWVPSNKGSSDVFAVGFADGSFRIYNKSGKM